jgi:hypothetical protein
MVDILEALNANEKEAKKLLKGKGEVMLAKWNDDVETYEDIDGADIGDVGVYVRYADDDGDITTKLVVGVRYNEDIQRIEIIVADDEYTKSDDVWFPISWCDDISYWDIFRVIDEMFG